MAEIVKVVKKGDLTVIHLSDGTFMVCSGPVETFETPAYVEKEPEVEEPEKVKDPDPEKEEEEEEEEPKKETTTGEDDEYWTKEDIEEMTKKELIELIEDEELDIDPDDFASVRKLRKEVIAELAIEE